MNGRTERTRPFQTYFVWSHFELLFFSKPNERNSPEFLFIWTLAGQVQGPRPFRPSIQGQYAWNTYIEYMHKVHGSSAYIHRIHTWNPYIEHIHRIHTSNIHIEYTHSIHTKDPKIQNMYFLAPKLVWEHDLWSFSLRKFVLA